MTAGAGPKDAATSLGAIELRGIAAPRRGSGRGTGSAVLTSRSLRRTVSRCMAVLQRVVSRPVPGLRPDAAAVSAWNAQHLSPRDLFALRQRRVSGWELPKPVKRRCALPWGTQGVGWEVAGERRAVPADGRASNESTMAATPVGAHCQTDEFDSHAGVELVRACATSSNMYML
jgi:hypothetical protein